MRTETRETLVRDATALVRRRGYAGFSYADLAEAVGIRKPSIHHHFPLKEDLGVAMVEAYTARFAERLADIAAASADRRGRLRAYAGLYREGLAAGQACLCGVLASELAGLPPAIRAGVGRFFAVNLDWLESVLREGAAQTNAGTVLATCQGAVFVALATGDTRAFDTAIAGLLDTL